MTDSEQIHHATVFDDATRHVARIYAERSWTPPTSASKRTKCWSNWKTWSTTSSLAMPAFALFLASAVVGREHKREVLRRAFEGKVNDILLSFPARPQRPRSSRHAPRGGRC